MRYSGKRLLLASALVAVSASAQAASLTIPMYLITGQGVGSPIGHVRAEDTGSGLKLTPELAGLPPGPHGWHIHDKPSCEPGMVKDAMQAGGSAGGHFDPDHTGKHLGPGGQGHKGDLPVLEVAPDGTAKTPVIAPLLSVAALQDHALIIHAGSDNYSDTPEPLGGGGARIACGVPTK